MAFLQAALEKDEASGDAGPFDFKAFMAEQRGLG
jgi:hypothetical protein